MAHGGWLNVPDHLEIGFHGETNLKGSGLRKERIK
jgi:hypothetical protein